MQISPTIKMIKIHLILFASFSDYLGVRQIDLDIKEGGTIKELQDLLFSKLSPAKSWNKPLLYAVNQAFATLDTKLKENDEVVFMPFVSGG